MAKKILPSELAELRSSGASGILIGVIVTGSTPDSIFEATREFARSARELSES